jgi:ABC-type nitrate/sulfonate/bicarbonate transport system substrate-binding protein
MTLKEIKRTVKTFKNARKEMVENPDKAVKLFVKAGILSKSGKLTKNYK